MRLPGRIRILQQIKFSGRKYPYFRLTPPEPHDGQCPAQEAQQPAHPPAAPERLLCLTIERIIRTTTASSTA